MQESTTQTSGASTPFQDEILKALVGKVVDLGAAVRENVEQVRKLTDQQDVLETVNERTALQEKQMVELIKKDGELQEDVKKMAEKLDVQANKIETLHQKLDDHARLFEKPLNKAVQYRHFVDWPFLVMVGMLLITVASVTVSIIQWLR